MFCKRKSTKLNSYSSEEMQSQCLLKCQPTELYFRDVCGIMVILKENRLGNMSSKPWWRLFVFPIVLIPFILRNYSAIIITSFHRRLDLLTNIEKYFN